jgi:hypothetical protein
MACQKHRAMEGLEGQWGDEGGGVEGGRQRAGRTPPSLNTPQQQTHATSRNRRTRRISKAANLQVLRDVGQ